jgi:hypothetical protein
VLYRDVFQGEHTFISCEYRFYEESDAFHGMCTGGGDVGVWFYALVNGKVTCERVLSCIL